MLGWVFGVACLGWVLGWVFGRGGFRGERRGMKEERGVKGGARGIGWEKGGFFDFVLHPSNLENFFPNPVSGKLIEEK